MCSVCFFRDQESDEYVGKWLHGKAVDLSRISMQLSVARYGSGNPSGPRLPQNVFQ